MRSLMRLLFGIFKLIIIATVALVSLGARLGARDARLGVPDAVFHVEHGTVKRL